MQQVTSRGCSRAYILCVLWRALQHVRRLHSMNKRITFPFDEHEVTEWLLQARRDAADNDFQLKFGGIDFYDVDSSTFWTHASHYYTWWKNNIERKTKFTSLLIDASYEGNDPRSLARATFCKQAIALAMSTKNHFQRILNQQKNGKHVIQIALPVEMPDHMQAVPYATDANIKFICCEDYVSDYLKSKSVSSDKAISKRKRKRDSPLKEGVVDRSNDGKRFLNRKDSIQRCSLSSSPNFDGQTSVASTEVSVCDYEHFPFDRFSHYCTCSRCDWNTLATDFPDPILIGDEDDGSIRYFAGFRGCADDSSALCDADGNDLGIWATARDTLPDASMCLKRVKTWPRSSHFDTDSDSELSEAVGNSSSWSRSCGEPTPRTVDAKYDLLIPRSISRTSLCASEVNVPGEHKGLQTDGDVVQAHIFESLLRCGIQDGIASSAATNSEDVIEPPSGCAVAKITEMEEGSQDIDLLLSGLLAVVSDE